MPELHETWEYKFVDLDFSSSENALSFGEEQLNELGRSGWEALSLFPRHQTWIIALLKRRIPK